jgi:hypothetical protein
MVEEGRERMKMPVRIATRLTASAMLLSASVPSLLHAASVAELSELAREGTFEVVLPKHEPAGIKYEKPLPLELLSFKERNDAFWSIGTAFALEPDTFVSNAHVLLAGMGSELGRPRLRDAAGNTYVINRVLKFSLHEDYIVFQAQGARAATALAPAAGAAVGAKVYAVGNAHGEGVVLRDGLLTSLTPEDQDGRWKWLRFSAAASPGNSGGPLLDEQGRVMGVVTARSVGENLNYALPIERVVAGSERQATYDVRTSFGLSILRQQMVVEFKGTFPLPASWEQFTQRLRQASDQQYEANQARLLEQHSAELPPGGRSEKLLGTLDRGLPLALIGQQPDDSWSLTAPDSTEETRVDGGHTLSMGSFQEVATFRWWRDPEVADPKIYRDPTAFMDMLLKGMRLPRIVGPQAIRITSLGAPRSQRAHTDRFGRTWQLREWPLGYTDTQLVTLALPTPQGYAGLIRVTNAAGQASAEASLKLLADYVHVSYEGSVAQWRAFVALKDLCPPFLRDLRFGGDIGAQLSLTGLDVQIPPSLLELDEQSQLTVFMGYGARRGDLVARPAGITIEERRHEDRSWLGVWAQPRPAASADPELQKRWRDLGARTGKFDGSPKREQNPPTYWTVSVVGDAERNMLYELTLVLAGRGLLPRHVSERRDELQASLKVEDAEE